jgi:hypothetical protein
MRDGALKDHHQVVPVYREEVWLLASGIASRPGSEIPFSAMSTPRVNIEFSSIFPRNTSRGASGSGSRTHFASTRYMSWST